MPLFLQEVWHNILMATTTLRHILPFSFLLLSGCSWFPFFSSTPAEEDAVTVVNNLKSARETDPSVVTKLSNLPVRVNYVFKSKPQVHEDLDVEVEYLILKDIHKMRLGYVASDGLSIDTPASPLYFEDMKKFQTLTQHLVIVPDAESHYFLRIYVVTNEGDDLQGKEIVIPIAVGKVSLEPSPQSKEQT